MAEIILEPTVQSKVIPLTMKINETDSSLVSQLVTHKQFNTADTDAWFSFTLDGLAATTGTFDLTLINLQDKSVFKHEGIAFNTNPFHYKLDSGADELTNEIRHAGKWVGQLVVTLPNGDSATRKFIFSIEGHILDGTVVQTILLEDYNALIADIESAKDELTQYNIDYGVLIANVESAEALRVQADLDREAAVDALIASETIELKVAEKYQLIESESADRLLSAEQQLEQKAEQTDLLVERGRVDNLVTNAGDLSGNAELLDIRVDKNGIIHSTAADNVRYSQSGGLVDYNKTALSKGFNKFSTLLTEVGALNSDGVNTTGLNAVRTPIGSNIDLTNGVKLFNYNPSQYRYKLWYFNKSDNLLNTAVGYITTDGYEIPANSNLYARLCVATVDGSNINHEDVIANFKITMLSDVNSLALVVNNSKAVASYLEDYLDKKVYFDWRVGDVGSTGLFKTSATRIAMYSIRYTAIDLYVSIDWSLYRMYSHSYADNLGSGYVSASRNSDFTIPAGTYFRLSIIPFTEVPLADAYGSAYKALSITYLNDLKQHFAEIEYANDNVKAINHRGYSLIAPENTMPAFKLSKKHGFKFVETDVAFTLNNVAVLLHDDSINRTGRNQNGTAIESTINIWDITYEQALAYDFGLWQSSVYAGTKLPTFDEFISFCKKTGLHPYIEIKYAANITKDLIYSLVGIVKKYGMLKNVSWTASSIGYLNHVKTAYPKARLGYISSVSLTSTTITNVSTLKNDNNEVFITLSQAYVNNDAATLCMDADIQLEIWTVNSVSTINNMHGYITGVTTDLLRVDKILAENSLI